MAEVAHSPLPLLRDIALRRSFSFSHILRSGHLSFVPKWYGSIGPIASGRSAAGGFIDVGLRNLHLLASSGRDHYPDSLSCAPLSNTCQHFGRKDPADGCVRARSCLADGQPTYSFAV